MTGVRFAPNAIIGITLGTRRPKPLRAHMVECGDASSQELAPRTNEKWEAH